MACFLGRAEHATVMLNTTATLALGIAYLAAPPHCPALSSALRRLTALHCLLRLPLEGTASIHVCGPYSCFAGLPVVPCIAALLLAGHNGKSAVLPCPAFPWCLFILHACFVVLPCRFLCLACCPVASSPAAARPLCSALPGLASLPPLLPDLTALP